MRHAPNVMRYRNGRDKGVKPQRSKAGPDSTASKFTSNHTPANHPKLSSKHLQLIQLCQLSAALFAYSSRFIAVLGVGCYLSGSSGCSDTSARPASMVETRVFPFHCRVTALLLSTLRQCVTLGAGHTPTESCVVSLHVVLP